VNAFSICIKQHGSEQRQRVLGEQCVGFPGRRKVKGHEQILTQLAGGREVLAGSPNFRASICWSNKVTSEVIDRLRNVPGMSDRGGQIATAVQSGNIKQTLGQLPANTRGTVGMITKTAFTIRLNYILLVAAIIALVSAVLSFSSIRTKDFAHHRPARTTTGQCHRCRWL